jgi:hypothetical protein
LPALRIQEDFVLKKRDVEKTITMYECPFCLEPVVEDCTSQALLAHTDDDCTYLGTHWSPTVSNGLLSLRLPGGHRFNIVVKGQDGTVWAIYYEQDHDVSRPFKIERIDYPQVYNAIQSKIHSLNDEIKGLNKLLVVVDTLLFLPEAKDA